MATTADAGVMARGVTPVIDCAVIAARHGAPAGGCPIANAGPDQTVSVGRETVLDATRSAHERNAALTYRWELVQAPLGSHAMLEESTTLSPRFTPDVRGAYVANLQVVDANGEQSSDFVTISTINSRPVAVAHADRQRVAAGDTVTFHARGSSDADGDALRYRWQLMYAPKHSQASLSSDSGATPRLTTDRDGEYAVRLTVEDAKGRSEPEHIIIRAGD
ncbi:MAG: PKD domain-containing protein [Pseudomonadota bacterium]